LTLPQTPAIGRLGSPTLESSAHIAIGATAAANPANEHAGEHLEIRNCA
jgi:hypothetical protein